MYGLISIFVAGVSTLSVNEFYSIFSKVNDRRKFRIAVCFLFFLWQIFCVNSIFIIPAPMRLYLNLLFIFIIGCFYEGVIWYKIILTFMYMVMWVLCEVLTGSVYLGFINIEKYHAIVCSSVSVLFLFLLMKIIHHFRNENLDARFSWKYNMIIMVISGGSLFIIYHMFVMSNMIGENKYRFISLLIFVILFSVNFAMLFIYRMIIEYHETKHNKEIYQLEVELLGKSMKEKENSIQEVRKAKHDLKHNLLYAIDLLEDNNYEQLSVYLRNLSDLDALSGKEFVNTGNSLVDTIVNYKYEIAQHQGIKFDTNLCIPTNLPFGYSELCVLLGNALDNAIEACQRGNVDEPVIRLEMRFHQNNLLIIVENTFDGKLEKESDRIATRKNEENHGIGLLSIIRTVEKYHGEYVIQVTDNVYQLKMILYGEE